MPSLFQTEDGEDYEQREGSSSASDEVIEVDSPIDVDFPEENLVIQPTSPSENDAQQQPESQPEPQEDPERTASPVPLVVSDIIAKHAAPMPTALLPAPKPVNAKMTKTTGGGTKRGIDTRTMSGPVAKRRQGRRREMPCVHCVRRLANDPEWKCHDALLGQSGTNKYEGIRCSECVGAHVSCHPVPDTAMDAVGTLIKAAADVFASDGADKIQLLAAYEAAIGPALRSVIPVMSIPISQEPQVSRPVSKPGRKPGRKPDQKIGLSTSTKPRGPRGPRGPYKPRQTLSGPSPRIAAATEAARSNGRFVTMQNPPSNHFQQQQHAHRNDPTSFFAPPPQQMHESQPQNDEGLEKLERQALRRRKVEALESISHTAALFLAEFMTFVKQQSSPAAFFGAEASADPGGQYSAASSPSVQNNGMDYAAAAARMAANVFNQSGNHHAGADLDNAYDSDSDSSDVSTIENNASAFRAAQAQRSGAHPADVLDDGSLDACFGIDGEVYEDEDLVVQKREESADDSADDRQMSEVKVEDG